MSEREDFVVETLKKKWFDLAGRENISKLPLTPEITAELNELTPIIREMIAENKENFDQS